MPTNSIYINSVGNVSPQKTTDDNHFPEEPLWYEANQLRCLDPGYRDFIPADIIRRMGRIIKMGVAAARLCLKDVKNPDAIITGTGLGCIEDTEKFLISMIRNKEEFLTPTSFIQSTHNTVAGQIALLLGCHSYNFTYVHRGISFESALTDAVTQLQLGRFSNVLAGGMDELTPNSFAIMGRLGYWKREPVNTRDLLTGHRRGTVAGEGAAFFLLEKEKRETSFARLLGVNTFLKPSRHEDLSKALQRFLNEHGLSASQLDLALLGLNGDEKNDRPYRYLLQHDLSHTPAAFFKHLCGEYHTASSFALWLASMILRTGRIPGEILVDPGKPGRPVRHLLIHNHFMENNHAFILLSRA